MIRAQMTIHDASSPAVSCEDAGAASPGPSPSPVAAGLQQRGFHLVAVGVRQVAACELGDALLEGVVQVDAQRARELRGVLLHDVPRLAVEEVPRAAVGDVHGPRGGVGEAPELVGLGVVRQREIEHPVGPRAAFAGEPAEVGVGVGEEDDVRVGVAVVGERAAEGGDGGAGVDASEASSCSTSHGPSSMSHEEHRAAGPAASPRAPAVASA
eukprot:CAMPEP_0119134256 /NCGR_PEP_ID=MMETSP1310-20130426/16161_1 /TAXON_ID=464262 /ORGANISM="Genus nov. species nov., Strain RCC2339" /LENGTH=211 /DNA_ID=CAMNT_0007125031 /DNA_START=115 /DNA_END=749 /DNA_ORIENTATION=+